MSELLENIRSRGHWRVVIRPGTFDEKRISNISNLYHILEKTSVQLRGWDFPHLDTRTERHTDVDWIGQEINWENHLELWRFYQSGQFVHFSGMDEDWRDQSGIWPPYEGWKPGALLYVEDILFQFTEIFEFAARLAMTEAGDDQMHLGIDLRVLKGRGLKFEVRRAGSLYRRILKADIEEMPYKVDLPRIQLVTEPSELALKPAVELFRRFGWDPSLDVIRDMQSELLRRGSLLAGRS
jgi:hypothetical protein